MPDSNSRVGREEFDSLVASVLEETLSREWIEYAIGRAIREVVNNTVTDLVITGSFKQDVLKALDGSDD
jgi:hypothetical protein